MNVIERCNIRQAQLLPARIKSKVVIDPRTGCWEWQGWNTGNGYGKISIKGSHRVVHRVVFGILVDEGLALDYSIYMDHLCRNRSCCNPAHIEPVTPRENTRRGVAVLFCKEKP